MTSAPLPRPLLTQILLGINIGLFLLQVLLGVSPIKPQSADLIVWGANIAPFTLTGQSWRLFTCMFLHIGIVHLVLNMGVLASIGPVAERYFGRINFLLIYVLAGLAASEVSAIWFGQPHLGNDSTLGMAVPHLKQAYSAGASAALIGLATALLAAHYLRQLWQKTPEPEGINMRFLLLMLCVDMSIGFLIPNVDNFGHITGAIVGALLGGGLVFYFNAPPSSQRFGQIGVLFITLAFGTWFWPHQSKDPALLNLRKQLEVRRELPSQPMKPRTFEPTRPTRSI